jgi:hypothetical protein
MGVAHENLPLAAFNLAPLIMSGTGLLTLGGAAFKAFERVEAGDMGVMMCSGSPLEKDQMTDWQRPKRLRTPTSLYVDRFTTYHFGEMEAEELDESEGQYVTVGPGIYLLRPGVDKIAKVSVKPHTDPVKEFDVESSDGILHSVEPTFTWHVPPDGDNPYRALFEITNGKDNNDKERAAELKQTVLSICAEGLGMVLDGRTSKELISINRKEVCQDVRTITEEDLNEFGVGLKRTRFPQITRVKLEVLNRGEKNTSRDAAIATTIAADEHGMGAVIPLRPGNDAA